MDNNSVLYVRSGKHTVGLTGSAKDNYILKRFPDSHEAKMISSRRLRAQRQAEVIINHFKLFI